MTTEQKLREALKDAFMEGYTRRATYNDIELSNAEEEWAKAQPALMALVQLPAPEQQAPQGIKLTHVFTPDVDAEQRKLCEKYRDLVQGVEKQDELKNALRSLDFYKARCDLLQKWQSKMRDPERTIVCDILANGQTMPDPTGARYGLPAAPEAAKPLFADLIAATPGAAEELKAVDAQADEVIRQYEKRQAEAAKPETERAGVIAWLKANQEASEGFCLWGEALRYREAAALLAADSKSDHTELLRMLAQRARLFPDFPMGYHMPEVFRAVGEEPPELADSKAGGEPALWVSPGQLENLKDPEGDHGQYLPARKSRAGLFTLPLYTRPQQQAKPLTEDDAKALAVCYDARVVGKEWAFPNAERLKHFAQACVRHGIGDQA